MGRTRLLWAGLLLAGLCRADPESDAADAVLTAFRAKQDLAPLAGKDEPDPWLVVESLCARGEFDAAEAFATAAPRVDTEKLPAYVAARRGDPPDPVTLRTYAVASAALRRGETDVALATIEKQEIPKNQAYGIRLLHLKGLALQSSGRLQQSAAVLEAAADAAHAIGWWAREALAIRQSAGVAYARADRDGALRAARRCLAVELKRGDKRAIAGAFHSLGLSLRSAGRYTEALAALEKAISLWGEVGDRVRMAHSVGAMGTVHGRRGAHADALACFERAMKLAKEVGDRDHMAGMLINIGIELENMGSYDAALQRLGEGLAIARELGNRQWEANALGTLADVAGAMGDYSRSLEYEREALRIAEEIGNRFGIAMSHVGLGSTQRNLGLLREAVDSHQRALQLAEAMGDRYAMSIALYNLGADYIDLGAYAKALAAHERALQLCGELGDRSGVGAGLIETGMIRRALGDYAGAERDLKRALAVQRGLGESSAHTLLNLGDLCLASDEFESARDYFDQARAEFAKLGAPDDEAGALAGKGIALRFLGADGEAERALRRALEAHERVGNRKSMAYDLCHLAFVHQHRGEFDKARRLLERAVTLAVEIGSPKTEARARSWLARNHLLRGAPQDAVDEARRAVGHLAFVLGGLGEEQGAGLRQEVANVFETGAAAAVELDRPADACFFLESGRAGSLLEGLGGRKRLQEAAIPRALREKEAKARDRERVAMWKYRRAAEAGDEVEAQWAEVEAAREEIVALGARVRREAKAQAELLYPEPASLAQIRAQLGPDDALVLYGTLPDGMFALVIRSDASRIVRLGESEAIEKACEAVQRAAARPDERGMRAPLHERLPFLAKRLRKLLIDPLDLAEKTKRVLISPAGRLAYVPFTVLTDRAVAYVPSGTTYGLLRDEASKRGAKVLALGDPATEERLPASAQEAEAVGDTVLLGEAATAAGLGEALAQHERWRAVHFACHGLVDPERPVLSELALTGEPLRCLDVYRMKIPADLVVLSACETGKGKIYKAEGVIGWTRAFMFAGAPRVIVSLWKVDDAATRALMEKFYELWKDGEVPAATALKQAQAHVAAQPQWKHPYFWAAWQLWGLGE